MSKPKPATDTVAPVASTDVAEHLSTVAAVAGFAALRARTARRNHASNEEQVKRGMSGTGALEVTVTPLRAAESELDESLDALTAALEAGALVEPVDPTPNDGGAGPDPNAV